jgi:chemotaxis protein MotB
MRSATHFRPRSHRRQATRVSRSQQNKPVWIVFLLVLVAFFSVGCISKAGYDEALRERDTAERQKRALVSRVQQLQLSTSNLSIEVKDLTGQLEDVEEERDGLQGKLGRLGDEHAVVQENLQVTQAELDRRAEEVKKLHGTYDALVSDLESEVASGQIQIQQLRDGLQVTVPDQILFASGSARLSPEGSDVLRRVAQQLASLPNPIQVVGHSDNRKIRPSLTGQYPSNWELAGARAAAVVRVFETVGITGDRLIAISRAEFAPIASNESKEERARNRRIEILLLPAKSLASLEATPDPVTPAP